MDDILAAFLRKSHVRATVNAFWHQEALLIEEAGIGALRRVYPQIAITGALPTDYIALIDKAAFDSALSTVVGDVLIGNTIFGATREISRLEYQREIGNDFLEFMVQAKKVTALGEHYVGMYRRTGLRVWMAAMELASDNVCAPLDIAANSTYRNPLLKRTFTSMEDAITEITSIFSAEEKYVREYENLSERAGEIGLSISFTCTPAEIVSAVTSFKQQHYKRTLPQVFGTPD